MGAQPPALDASQGARLWSGVDARSVREMRTRWNPDLPIWQQRVSAGQAGGAVGETVSNAHDCRDTTIEISLYHSRRKSRDRQRHSRQWRAIGVRGAGVSKAGSVGV